MKIINSVIAENSGIILLILLMSCSEQNSKNVPPNWEKALLLQDSILVDYMEELTIMDASEEFEEFLAVNGKTDEVIIFNFQGTITNYFQNPKDSPNSINGIFSLSFMEKDIIVGGKPLKLAIYDKEGNQKRSFKMPSLVPRGSSLRQKQIFATSDNKILGHLHAYPDSALSTGLINPMLVLIDPENEFAAKPLLKIPENSKYSNGQFHGYVFPIINYSEDELFLTYSNDPTLYIYTYNNEELILDKTIDLGITDFIEIHPSTTESTYNFDKNHREMKPGMIWRILMDDSHIYIIYAKGIPENKFENEIHNKVTKNSIESNPLYLMVLDKNNKILQKDITIPYYMIGGLTCVSNNGTFIGRKSPVFSDIESDNEIFYTFNLVEQK